MARPTITEFNLLLPGELRLLHNLTLQLAKEEVNLLGIMTERAGHLMHLRFVADKESRVPRAIEATGLSAIESQVLHLEIPNRQGEFNKVVKALLDNNIHLIHAYGTANGSETARLIMTVDQPQKAESALERWQTSIIFTAR